MRHIRLISSAVALLTLVSASACASAATPAAPTAAPTDTPAFTEAPITGGDPAPTATIDYENLLEDFDPSNFDDPTNIDNPWLPMKLGTQWIYEGVTEEGGLSIPHRLIITVTDLTKVIGGVRTVVSWDEDYSAGNLVEAELAFFAQDDDGNVWRLGEYPEVYDEYGKLVEAPAWIHGLKGSRAGFLVNAEPRLGMPSYSQGWGPAVGFTDRGQVDQMGQQTCVPVDCYENVLVVAEFTREEPDAFQLKYYARGVGNVRVGWRGADATQEDLELVDVVQLSPESLTEVRMQALELEKRAYQISKEVYGQTPPAEYPEGTPALAITPAVAETPLVKTPEGSLSEVIVYASDLPTSALFELELWDDPASPGGRLIGLPNNGDELDPPPEDDPHVTFKVPVQGGVPYRCWIHMKVGAPKGKSQANVLWVQFSDAVDQANQEAFKPDTGSYLTAEGPTQEGWTWVECDRADSEAEPLVYFRTGGEITVRLQAGMEGVGFDQFLLSPARFLEAPPSEAVVEK